MKTHAAVTRDELERVVREYRHVHEEHRRARRGGHTRRRLGARLEQLAVQFERLLAETALDEDARRRWRRHLRRGTPEPEGAAPERPLVFRGRSDAGSELRLLVRADGSIDAIVDGAVLERLDSAGELEATAPGLTFPLAATTFHETFLASPAACEALRTSLETGAPLEPDSAAELLADGIVDPDLALTPRGRRALALDELPAQRAFVRSGTLSVGVRGPVPRRARVELEQMLGRLARFTPRPPLHARGWLLQEEDPALERPVLAKARLDLGRRIVRAQVAAASAPEAIDLLESRLRRNLLDLAERDEAARHQGRAVQPGAWRHGDLPSQQTAFFDRPVDERRLVRRKSFAAEPATAEEAAWEMRLLDHDFHLFTEASGGEDALVYVRDDGVLGLKRIAGGGAYVEPFRIDADPAPSLSVEQATERLSATQERFVFFVESESARGAVLYRRHDGHYGLVTMHPLEA